MIFNKEKEIHVDFFTLERSCIDLTPIVPAIECIPQWWKNLPTKMSDPMFGDIVPPTVRKCPGFIEYYKTGFMLPMWCDIRVNVSKEGGIHPMVPSQRFSVEQHPPEQHAGFLSSFQNLKLKAPWHVREKTGAKFLGLHPVWNYPVPVEYTVPTGILDFKYQNSIHVNTMVEIREEKYSYNLNIGDPVYHLIPLSEKPVKIHLHQVTEAELRKLDYAHFSFFGVYNKMKKLLP